MKKNHILLTLLLACFLPGLLVAQSLGWNNNRIACSADGNNQADNNEEAKWPRADPDDWGGTPAALAMIAKLKLQDNLVHYSYNNFIGAPPHTTETNYMADGVNGAIERWGFDASRFFDVPEDNATAITHLANELKKSTVDDPLYFIHMGPAEFFYRAVKEVVDGGNIDALSHVFVISHSGYNDTHLRRYAHHTMQQAIELSGNRIQYKKIVDQNACDNPNVLWCSGTNFAPFQWMLTHPEEGINWLYSRLQFHPGGKGADISDAGMVWYLLMGDEYGNLSKFKNFIGNGIIGTEAPKACENVSWNGVQDFEMMQIDTFVLPYKDTGRNAIAINAGQYKNKFGASQKVFDGASSYYNITLTTLTEEDGESTYRLSVNGELVGEVQNPEAVTDMAPTAHVFEQVLVRNGDVIQIESNSHSNGKIPEGDGFAFARGRWRSIDFECLGTEDCAVEEKDGLLVFEAERMELKGDWKLGEDADKASGGKYIYYDGPNSYDSPNMDNHISYTFKVNKAGNYTVKWTMRQPEGERGTDKGNDVYIYLSDDIGYGQNQQLTEYEKFYTRSDDDFMFGGVAEIHNVGHSWLTAKIPSAGEYTINFVGRSHGLQIDRIVLFTGMSQDDAISKVSKIAETTNCSYIPPAEEKVGISGFPTKIPNKQLNIEVKASYTANEARDLNISVLNPDHSELIAKTLSVAEGSGLKTVAFSFNQNWAIADGYTIKVALLPVGGNIEQAIALKEFAFNVVDGAAPADKDDALYLDVPSTIPQNQLQVPIKVSYSATEARDVNIEVKKEVYITNSLVTVPAGYGDTTILINFANPLGIYDKYRFILAIRPVGGDWKTNITKKEVYFAVTEAKNTALEEIKSALNVYPNPFKQRLHFTNNGQIQSVEMYDVNGRIVFSKIAESGLNTFSLAHLNRGAYIMKIALNDNSHVAIKTFKQ